MEPVLWLIAPLIVTVIVALVLLRRERDPHPAHSQELQREQLARIEQALRPDHRGERG